MRALACALTALVLLAGCDNHGDHPSPPLPTGTLSALPTQNTPSASFTVPTAPPSDVVTFATPPAPDAANRVGYLSALDDVDTDIVHGKPDQAVQRGIDTCGTFQQFPGDLDRLIGLAHERFTSPDHPFGFNIGTTKYILQTVHTWLCPDYPVPAELTPTPVTPEPDDTGDRPEH